MLEEEEILRFRDDLNCPMPREECEWVERANGSVWCVVCGSGYTAANREILRWMYGA